MNFRLSIIFAALLSALAPQAETVASLPVVPGIVIDHIPASTGTYIGSPSIAILPTGEYVASHDLFGPKTTEHKLATSLIFQSTDTGRTWNNIATIEGAFWSTLFAHHKSLYLLGTNRHHGDIVIRRSDDGGKTWTKPSDKAHGLLRDTGECHCAPMPVLEFNGRLWRAFEWRNPPEKWGVNYCAGMLSVAVDADLLNADNWTFSNFVPSDRAWNNNDMGAWLEGNAVATADGKLLDILRVQTKSPDEKAAIVHISTDGKEARFDPAKDFISFPGGAKKFSIRYDPQSKKYWTLANILPAKDRPQNPGSVRNILALNHSNDLLNWQTQSIVLKNPDTKKHGFQYVDWLIEGDDIIFVSRTAYDDDTGGAHNYHDANFMTFHRIENFRNAK